MVNLGYCCISIGINAGKHKKDFITVNRGMTKKTFELKGLPYVSELAIKNINDLQKILEYNIKNKIYVYRMSSDMFPCIGFYKLEDLPNFQLISNKLKLIGDFAKSNNIRLSFHPSHFCVIGSDKQSVIDNSIDELNKHAQIMDLMGLDQSYYYPINIHINTTKPSREDAAERFCNQFYNLSESCRKRLVVENDDGPNQYSVKLLHDLVYSKIRIPITFDFHHHNYGPQDLDLKDALALAISTWGNIKPMTHISSPKTIEDIKSKKTAHADYIYEEVKTFDFKFDIEVEAKAKDIALLKYRTQFQFNG